MSTNQNPGPSEQQIDEAVSTVLSLLVTAQDHLRNAARAGDLIVADAWLNDIYDLATSAEEIRTGIFRETAYGRRGTS